MTDALSGGASVALGRDQAHYLGAVMRLGPGANVLVFNGRDGEWASRIETIGKRGGALTAETRTRAQEAPPDLHLLFAPIKKARTDFIAEKAAEMGVAKLQPVFTRFTNSERVNEDRLRAHAIEAAEQCGLLTVPEVAAPARLAQVLESWDPTRRLMFCNESAPTSHGPGDSLRAAGGGPWAVLIGPEGGFAPEEADALRAKPYAATVSLGPRILRADTAAVAALTLWQSVLGDWA